MMHQVICDGGLANRLNTLLVALFLKQTTGTAWGMAWPVNNWCGAPFSELFEPVLPCSEHGLSYFKRQQDRYLNVFHENQIGFDEGRLVYNKKMASLPELQEYVTWKYRIAYFHHSIPAFITDEHLKDIVGHLRPVQAVWRRVKQLAQEHRIDAETIGVHIRKTDFGASVDEAKIFDAIKHSSHRHFICSDSQEVMEMFSALPNCACIPKPSVPRKLNPNGGWNDFIQDADGRVYPFNVDRDREAVIWGLIDFLLLIRTKMVVTSGSSFLALAQRLQRLGYADIIFDEVEAV
jgi:hypothetical protein